MWCGGETIRGLFEVSGERRLEPVDETRRKQTWLIQGGFTRRPEPAGVTRCIGAGPRAEQWIAARDEHAGA